MSDPTPVAVCSRSFSRHPVLRRELLERYLETTFNDEGVSLSGDALVEFLQGKRKAITALETVDDALLSRLPELEVISKVGVGIDMIDLDALARHGVRLGWATGTNRRSVSELVVALVLALSRHLLPANTALRDGGWSQPKGSLLSGRTVGIVGFGNVGRDLAELVATFGCPVLVHDVAELTELTGHITQVGLDELLERADVVSLHVTLNNETRNLIDAERLSRMKPTALLINTSRGGLVDEEALFHALRDGRLGGAGFDVFADEPPVGSPLLSLPNFVGTPHIGGSTEEAILAMGRAAIEGLDSARPVEEIASVG